MDASSSVGKRGGEERWSSIVADTGESVCVGTIVGKSESEEEDDDDDEEDEIGDDGYKVAEGGVVVVVVVECFFE